MANIRHSKSVGATKGRRICVRIPLAEHRRIKSHAKRQGVSMAEYCRRALLELLAISGKDQ